MDAELPQRLSSLKTQEAALFLEKQILEAQVSLYRGFIHEVNNALAGIGTLAETLKGAQQDVLDPHLDLIIHASSKSAQLQRRIRTLMAQGGECTHRNVVEFLAGNKDLMDLMLPYDQRFRFEKEKCVAFEIKATDPSLWRLFSVLLGWFVKSGAASAIFVTGAQNSLRLVLDGLPAETMDARWADAMEILAAETEAAAFVGASEVAVVWG